MTEIAGPILRYGKNCYATLHYLVESLEGELLCVVRYLVCLVPFVLILKRNYCRKRQYRTTRFDVFKLEKRSLVNGQINWSIVESLRNQVLFVGPNHSFALSADVFPQFRSNCIYFTEDYLEGYISRPYGRGCHDTGVYSLDDRSVESFYLNAPYWQTPPIWFQQR